MAGSTLRASATPPQASSAMVAEPIGCAMNLAKAHPDLEISVEAMATQGEQDSRLSLWRRSADKACSTKELRPRMLLRSADYCCPQASGPATNLPEGLMPCGSDEREDPADALWSTQAIRTRPWPHCPKAVWWAQLLRRLAQLRHHFFPHTCVQGCAWQLSSTRLEKLDARPVNDLPDPAAAGWDASFLTARIMNGSTLISLHAIWPGSLGIECAMAMTAYQPAQRR